jgi:hypothetical protein
MKSTLPKFSNEADWEVAIFELSLVLDRVWPHKEDVDIMDYMTAPYHRRSITGDMEDRADRLIYFALTTSAKKDSYAKLQIVASCHRDAVPCVMKNEGKKLYEMFQSLFTMTNLHQASLPTVRAEFYAITQKNNETILQYTSRVDIIVATLAKLGEKVSTGAWIYALGNGLNSEFKECKDGILYNKAGYDNVMSVKTKLLSEEAVLTSKLKRTTMAPTASTQDADEIALVSLKLKDSKTDTKQDPTTKTPDASKETALFTKGKGGKGSPNGKGNLKGNNLWTEPQWESNWGQAATGAKNRTTANGIRVPEAKVREKGNTMPTLAELLIPSPYGAIFINVTATQPTGVLKTLTGQEVHPPQPTDYGVKLAIDPDTQPILASQPLSVLPPRERVKPNLRAAQEPTETATGRVRTSLPTIILTKTLHDESPSSTTKVWWDDQELGSALMDTDNNPALGNHQRGHERRS